MSATLKPCPFCGSKARVFVQYERDYRPENRRYSVSCEGHDVGCGHVFFFCETEEEAVAIWNRRTN